MASNLGADIVVIGAGIVGLATVRKLLMTAPGSRILVLEKEADIASHQTGHNSGVVHAGVYYTPGSLKARLCRQGAQQLRTYCAEHNLPYRECGKLIVAVDKAELPRLDAVYRRGVANGVALRRVSKSEIREIEPHAAGIAAISSPTTAVVDFPAVCRSLVNDITQAGGEVATRAHVTAIHNLGNTVAIETTRPDRALIRCSQVVVAAGLQSDRVAALAGDTAGPRIVPFRGMYYRLRPERRCLVNALIYPVPDPRYPFLGIHLTRTVTGDVLVGPNAVLALSREGYKRPTTFRFQDVVDTTSWPGTWAMARQHWKTGGIELARAASRRLFVREARKYVPELAVTDVQPAGSGVRAQAVGRSGNLVDDFVVTRVGRVVNIRNAPSPAATSSFAIADYVTQHPRDGFT